MGTPTYEAIATASATTGQGTSQISFNAIPQTYTHLIVVADIFAGSAAELRLTAANASNYVTTFMATGTSGTPSVSSVSSTAQFRTGSTSVVSTGVSSARFEIFNYSLSSRHKPVLYRMGRAAAAQLNGTGIIEMTSGAAIASIGLSLSVDDFNTGTTITLYGVK